MHFRIHMIGLTAEIALESTAERFILVPIKYTFSHFTHPRSYVLFLAAFLSAESVLRPLLRTRLGFSTGGASGEGDFGGQYAIAMRLGWAESLPASLSQRCFLLGSVTFGS